MGKAFPIKHTANASFRTNVAGFLCRGFPKSSVMKLEIQPKPEARIDSPSSPFLIDSFFSRECRAESGRDLLRRSQHIFAFGMEIDIKNSVCVEQHKNGGVDDDRGTLDRFLHFSPYETNAKTDLLSLKPSCQKLRPA